MNVSVVVPAYNEASRIGAVLRPILDCPLVDDVIVVDDGSEDGTAKVARGFDVEVISLPDNRGKAAALDAGVNRAINDNLLFLDADLVGLQERHVTELIDTYFNNGLDMVVGVFSKGRKNTDFAQTINPFASGQRLLSKKLWGRASTNAHEMEFGIEVTISKLAAKEAWRKEKVKLDGVTHVLKEEKRGFVLGMQDRLKMYGSMIKWLFKKI